MLKTISSKLTFSIIAGSIIILSIIVFFAYKISSRLMEKQIEDNARNLTLSVVNKIDTILMPIEKIPQSLAIFLEHSPYNKKRLIGIIKTYIKTNPDIYGCAIAFRQNTNTPKNRYATIYVYRRKGKIITKSITYNYIYSDWYQLPKELNKPIWTEPYYGKDGNTIMTTYSVPFYRTINRKREFVGVVTADVSLDWLQHIISSIKVSKTGYAFLISKNGRFITYPNKRFIMNETIFTVAEEYNMPYLRKIGLQMIHGKKGFLETKSILTHEKCWLSFAPITANGWSVGVVFPQKELMAGIHRLDVSIVVIGILGIFMLSIVVSLTSTSITKPLGDLTKLTKSVAKGNLDIEIPYTDLNDEVGDLARSFKFMKNSLKEYIENLKETTAAKERIQSELNIAAKIQSSMLPQTFPAFPGRTEFDIYAFMKPAKEVGGDFYDFFFINENKLYFSLFDVSGKGVPASLFMAILKYLLKIEAKKGESPSEILSKVNNIIAEENKACMFATGFIGILDVNSGVIEFSNAGHLPPIVCTEKKIDFLKVEENFVVGAIPNIQYKTQKLKLNKNNTIIIYTDGVTEAKNLENELFSSTLLIEKVKKYSISNINPKELINQIKKEIETFSKGAPQADDITILALKLKK